MFLHKFNYVPPPFVPQGNAALASSPVRFGSGSLSLLRGYSGGNYGGVVYNNVANNIGTGDFTLEGWVYAVDPNAGFSELNSILSLTPTMSINATYKLVQGNPPQYEYTYTIANGTYNASINVYMGFWGYVCLMRYNGRVYFFCDDGTLYNGNPPPIATNSAVRDSNNFYGIPNTDAIPANATVVVGCNYSLTKGFNGYMDQVRLSNIARYSSTINSGSSLYQVPQTQFSVDANTVLLASYNGIYDNLV